MQLFLIPTIRRETSASLRRCQTPGEVPGSEANLSLWLKCLMTISPDPTLDLRDIVFFYKLTLQKQAYDSRQMYQSFWSSFLFNIGIPSLWNYLHSWLQSCLCFEPASNSGKSASPATVLKARVIQYNQYKSVRICFVLFFSEYYVLCYFLLKFVKYDCWCAAFPIKTIHFDPTLTTKQNKQPGDWHDQLPATKKKNLLSKWFECSEVSFNHTFHSEPQWVFFHSVIAAGKVQSSLPPRTADRSGVLITTDLILW